LSSVFEQVLLFLQNKSIYQKSTKNGIIIAALIKEDTTIPSKNPEHRFQIIALAVGENHQRCCKDDICDGHDISLCYHAAPIYFQTKLKKMRLRDTTSSSLFYSTKDGYVIKPYYKFTLFTSRPPCGFMSDEKKHLLSWKIPFENLPHIPECSSRILINSYLGIQGPLTTMFAQPVYISDIIVLNYNEDEDQKAKNIAVLKDINAKLEKIEKQLEESEKQLQKPDRFHFCKPEITMHQIKLSEYHKMLEDKVKKSQSSTVPSCAVCVPDEVGNEGHHIFTYTTTAENNSFNQNNQEKKMIQELWEFIQDDFLMDSEQLLQFQHRFTETKEALKRLFTALDLNKSIQKAKEELEAKVKHNEKIMDESLSFIKEAFVSLNLKDTQQKEDNTNKKFQQLAAMFKEKKDILAMLESLGGRLQQDITEYYDCTWERYCSLMQNAIKKE